MYMNVMVKERVGLDELIQSRLWNSVKKKPSIIFDTHSLAINSYRTNVENRVSS